MKGFIIIGICLLSGGSVLAQSGNSRQTTTERAAFATCEDEKNYQLNASFPEQQTAALKAIIIQAAGKPDETSPALVHWYLRNRYEISLRPGKLHFELRKDQVGPETIRSFRKLAEDISSRLSSLKNHQT